MLIDYPNSLVAGGVAVEAQTITERPHSVPISVVEERVPPPGSEVVAPPTKVRAPPYLCNFPYFSSFLFRFCFNKLDMGSGDRLRSTH